MKKLYKRMPSVYFDDYCLRTIKKSDAKDMYEYGKDPEVTQFLNWGPFIMPVEAKKSIQTIFYPRIKEGLPRGYAVIDLKKSKMIGTIDFHSKIINVNGAEVGFVIHKDYWNQGIMSKALNRLIQIGFDYLDYDLIRIKHLKKNVASQKVILKNGFKYIKSEMYILEKRDQVLKDELLTYELTREDYHVNQQS
ncbi:MAG: GNAT family N-acetyltransferase [Acholeplasmataceae bacterium]|nr:GNAT family N-acetyltransferase [Acholeplasmataceae bacterium]